MNQISLRDFRCFRNEQVARLAPLTLLVGENSTGKTSFLALIRALWDIGFRHRVPDFKEEPYDLGSFDEIAHHRGARGGRTNRFSAGFSVASTDGSGSYRFSVTFGKQGTVPFPVQRSLTRSDRWIDEHIAAGGFPKVYAGTSRGSWRLRAPRDVHSIDFNQNVLNPLVYSVVTVGAAVADYFPGTPEPQNGSPEMGEEDWDALQGFAVEAPIGGLETVSSRPFASAPVRSRPRRTYDPARPMTDPEGAGIPMYLADVFFRSSGNWSNLKTRLEEFGRTAGLFDEIAIKSLGTGDAGPFQLQIRKYGGSLKGPRRNLIDVGYGVSQVLPIVTELLRQEVHPMFLLQQPEVHLHPSAQAALGSLFCQIASSDRQLVVETHSDHLLDRIRMDVRDRTSKLKPDDVSILFFERNGLDVRIHSLCIDQEGNVRHTPDGYRRFFIEETQRSLGL
ncbi:MAG: AAA family ATPase [Gammaproteobacteria bacterium]|nr:AAA family ATPase [Gammaproteobacteria bacterium]